MTKKKTTTQVQMLSPENYIRQKSRNLPIYKCWINDDWVESRFAQIVIARQHANENITFCLYLVDLGCLGVKDTVYDSNISLEELEELIKKIGADVKMDDTLSYSMAHNIIYAAIEFAEEFGFKPHKDFTQTTQFFLEEDTDDIPLIKIDCGDLNDGQPFYINTGYENSAREKQIISQLNKTAGNGNYHCIMGAGNPMDYEDSDYEDHEKYGLTKAELKIKKALFNKVGQLSKEEQITLFIELYEQMATDLNQVSVEKLVILTQLLAEDYIDEEAITQYIEELFRDLDCPTVEPDELPNSLFVDVQGKDFDLIYDLYFDTLDAIEEDAKIGEKALETFRDKVGDVPIVAYAELDYLKRHEKKEYVKKLEEYYTKYPDYFLIQLDWYQYSLHTQTNIFQKNINKKKIKTLLSESKQHITSYEAELFLFSYLDVFIHLENMANDPVDVLTKVVAIENYLASIADGSDFSRVNAAFFIAKMTALSFILTEDKSEK
ncbi:hypothetical protein AGMMS49525_13550 [Bacteroidia bacterium]|nr:hypothetical protein AGMMS49525_13550 [Bacteroidia bacterium]